MTLNHLVSENQRLAIHGADRLESQIKGVHDAISELKIGMDLQSGSTRVGFHASPNTANGEGSSVQQLDSNIKLTQELSALAEAVTATSDHQTTLDSFQVILDSFWFKNMNERQANITNPHKETFRWALDEPSSFELKDWLRSQRGIFWVRGKAGSGKSTFMKFLVNHPETTDALKEWAGNHRLITGSFFFWEAGSMMQKSQRGLFASLLHEILRQCPELIHPVMGSKLGNLQRNLQRATPNRHRWTRDELWEIIERLGEQNEVDARFCFFIDGLDEYDGEPDEIARVLDSLRRWPKIKLCVSCRPWNEFLDAYKSTNDLHISLEDLTRDDIKLYVYQTLEENARFRALKVTDSRSQSLLQEIVEKARGVFLWVVLVVKSLLTGLTNADKISRLRTRLHNFPETLEKFFDHMLSKVDRCYGEDTALAFKYALEAEEPLSLMTFSFLDEDDYDVDTEPKNQPLRPQEIARRQDDMKRRINGHCKGLLEVVHSNEATTDAYLGSMFYPKVEFLHRTVRDFLLSTSTQTKLSKNLPMKLDAKERLCRAHLAQLQRLDYSAFEPVPTSEPNCLPGELLEDFIFYARARELEVNLPQVTLMNELGQLVYRKADYFQLPKTGTGYLEYLVQRRLHLYISHVLTQGSHLPASKTTKLLAIAMRPKATKYLSKEYDLAMIELLLEHGALPNDGHSSDIRHPTSIWGDLLHSLNSRTSEIIKEPLLIVIDLFLHYGANPDARIAIQPDMEPLSAQSTSTSESINIINKTKPALQILGEVLPAHKAYQLQSEYSAKRLPYQLTASSQREPDRINNEELAPLPR